ncbi:hypothetical protein BDV38DRAFT_258123 [Aspergillus pseudotamarii]|uniref:Uncharacterized protein n=1 Tax=Aspergillus pseudotamarii TaxID=132259 RepID=A0A5N6SFH2_ASPPS|nr:uncharacterized protein BDV38DRAFT_258123 [Aspergillus pseudotamarii]KAE8133468.1 hypothetical protein BDV38DRAFT_258123 [Aspergillus pseudotamarii]
MLSFSFKLLLYTSWRVIPVVARIKGNITLEEYTPRMQTEWDILVGKRSADTESCQQEKGKKRVPSGWKKAEEQQYRVVGVTIIIIIINIIINYIDGSHTNVSWVHDHGLKRIRSVREFPNPRIH